MITTGFPAGFRRIFWSHDALPSPVSSPLRPVWGKTDKAVRKAVPLNARTSHQRHQPVGQRVLGVAPRGSLRGVPPPAGAGFATVLRGGRVALRRARARLLR